ncbi:putative acetyltransferase [Burkholderia cenocepacia]|nr:GCN5-related N-acetyltransferase [Burkholderia cenocepacia KC-01]QND97187.1 putative acetyltransferase [Burkholderia cenocepacia]
MNPADSRAADGNRSHGERMAPNTTTIDIRAATSADAPAIASIHVASWQATYMDIMPAPFLADLSVEKRTAAWRETLDAGRPHVALAFANHAPTGWIAYGPTRDADKDDAWGEIEAIYLHPSHCGQGIGARLVDHACRALHDAGHAWVSLWVLAKNRRARMFYEREGFVAEDDIKTFEIDGTPIEEVRYWRALP